MQQDVLYENTDGELTAYSTGRCRGLFQAVSPISYENYEKELNDLYSSPNIVRVIKSRRVRWAGHVALSREKRGVYRILVGKPQ